MVVWCCATANTKPRFQPSDDAEYCLYVKLSASAGLTTKTSTAHNSGENFATMLPPSRAFLRRPTSSLITDWGFQSVKKCAHSGCRRIFLGRGTASCAAVARVSACLSAMAARHFAGWTRGSARNWSFSASLNVASYARRARVIAPSEKRQHGKRNRDERNHAPSYHDVP